MMMSWIVDKSYETLKEVVFATVLFINPRRACTARVTVVVVPVSVCQSVCPLSHISHLGLLFVVKTLPHTQHATKVNKKIVAFSLKLRLFRATALPALYGYSQPFSLGGIRACASKMPR